MSANGYQVMSFPDQPTSNKSIFLSKSHVPKHTLPPLPPPLTLYLAIPSFNIHNHTYKQIITIQQNFTTSFEQSLAIYVFNISLSESDAFTCTYLLAISFWRISCL